MPEMNLDHLKLLYWEFQKYEVMMSLVRGQPKKCKNSNFLEAHSNNNLLKENQFTVLRKCQNKFDCLVFEMLFIKILKPNLNILTDSIRAKLFV